jgi:hypothetical protein
MGKWLEVLRDRPPEGADGYAERRPSIVAEIAPHPLLRAGRCLGREHRRVFPALDRIREDSPAYVDEWLWLDERQIGAVLEELRRVRRICRREEFLAGLDGRRYHDLWRDGDSPETFEAWLDRIEQVLGSEAGRWALLAL